MVHESPLAEGPLIQEPDGSYSASTAFFTDQIPVDESLSVTGIEPSPKEGLDNSRATDACERVGPRNPIKRKSRDQSYDILFLTPKLGTNSRVPLSREGVVKAEAVKKILE